MVGLWTDRGFESRLEQLSFNLFSSEHFLENKSKFYAVKIE